MQLTPSDVQSRGDTLGLACAHPKKADLCLTVCHIILNIHDIHPSFDSQA